MRVRPLAQMSIAVSVGLALWVSSRLPEEGRSRSLEYRESECRRLLMSIAAELAEYEERNETLPSSFAAARKQALLLPFSEDLRCPVTGSFYCLVWDGCRWCADWQAHPDGTRNAILQDPRSMSVEEAITVIDSTGRGD